MAEQNIQDLMNSEEGKKIFNEMFDKIISEKGYKAPEDVQGLVNKRDELLSEITKKNEKIKNVEKYLTKLQEYGIMDINDIDKKLGKSIKDDTPGGNSELNAIKRELETERKTREDLQKALNEQKQTLYNTKKNETILKTLSSVGVSEDAAEVLSVYFDKFAEIEDKDGKFRVMADDGEQRLTLSDYISQWSRTEKAKQYIKADHNSGGGATGSQTKPTGKMTPEQIAALPTRAERYQAQIDNGMIQN